MSRWGIVAVVVAGALMASSCSSGGELQSNPASDCDRFVSYDDSDWQLVDAVDYSKGLGQLESAEPSLDWYASYERFDTQADGRTVEGLNVRVSGYGVSLDEHSAELFADATSAQIDGREAVTVIGSDGEPAIVTLAMNPEFTVMLLSYELALVELIEIAGELRPVCQADWIAAGGQVLDCVPFEPGCGTES